MCIHTKTSINTYTKQNEWARLQIHRIGAKQTGTTHGRKHCHTTISASKRRILTKVVPNESSWQPAQQYVELFLVKSSRRETESNKHLKIAYFGRFGRVHCHHTSFLEEEPNRSWLVSFRSLCSPSQQYVARFFVLFCIFSYT